jgi:Fur family transcriptional regulator, ferric uptake regulator
MIATSFAASSAVGNPPSVKKERFESGFAVLKRAGLRITRPRVALLTALSNHVQPVTVDQLHDDVGRKKCDLVTVYRCIATFEEIGLVQRCGFFPNGTVLYKMEAREGRRYHIVCRATNTLDDIDEETSRELREAMRVVEEKLRARGYSDLGHVLEFFAVRETRPDRPQFAAEAWNDIARFYGQDSKNMRPLLTLVQWIISQGLEHSVYASTSLFDLVISDKPAFRDANNMLRIAWDRVRSRLEFRFESVSDPNLSVVKSVSEARAVDMLREFLELRFGLGVSHNRMDSNVLHGVLGLVG